MTDAQRENLRDLLLAARRRAGMVRSSVSNRVMPSVFTVDALVADLDSALEDLQESGCG